MRRGSVLWLALMGFAACSGGPDSPSGPAGRVASVALSPDSADLRAGSTLQLAATPRDAQGVSLAGQNIAWTSGAPAVASVSARGLVTAVAPGRAEITATTGGRAATAVVRVLPAVDSLPGAASALAGAAVPAREVPFDTTHYRTDNPRLPGMPVSVNRLNVLLKPTATVGEVNGLLAELEAQVIGGLPGGGSGGLLVLKLPTTSSAQIEAARTLARAKPFVQVATTDVRLTPTIATRPNAGQPTGWTFTGLAVGPTWGLEFLFVPAMWNLNGLVLRSGATAIEVGVLDVGFFAHEDLPVAIDQSNGIQHTHGSHVAGTIGAAFDNAKGVDGVNPYARLLTRTNASIVDLAQMVVTRPQMRVASVSLGYNWYVQGINPSDPATGGAARDQATDDGQQLHWALLAVQGQLGRLPAIFVSAGNDSDTGRLVEARYNSPYGAAALVHGNKAITVVESVGKGGVRSAFSDIGGHLSAPGEAIWSTVAANGYAASQGTSMATPHLAGLASYLYAVEPSLPPVTATSNPVRDVLLANAIGTLGGSAPSADAFRTALDLDRVMGGDRILRALLDIDDGSPDGNLRVTAQGAIENGEDLDQDGHAGDGSIDMSDFRRFRDAFAQVEGTAGLALDGGPAHAKLDLNRDRRTDAPSVENVWPRADFNGDGFISAFKVPMRGALAGQALSDLEVLQSRFSDPHYQASQLPSLLESGDIAVLLQGCTSIPGVVTLRLQARVAGTDPVEQQRLVPKTAVHEIFTLPANILGYTVTVEGLDGSGNVVANDRGDFPADVGGDAWFTTACKEVRISTTPAVLQHVQANVSTPVTILVEQRDPVTGTWSPAAGASLELSMVHGSLSSTSGTANALGQATVGVTWSAAGPGLLVIEATLADGPSGSAQVGVGGAPLSLSGGQLPNGQVGAAYTSGVAASGGIPPYTYALAGGSLPPGLSLNPATGAIAGTPSVAGTYGFTVRVTAAGETASANYSITVSGAGSSDPWSGAYEGSGGGVDVGLFIGSYHSGSATYAASISILVAGTTTTIFSSSFCSVYGLPVPPGAQGLTTVNLSCGTRGGTLTRTTESINGVMKRVITGTLRNFPNDPANPTGRETYDIRLVEK